MDFWSNFRGQYNVLVIWSNEVKDRMYGNHFDIGFDSFLINSLSYKLIIIHQHGTNWCVSVLLRNFWLLTVFYSHAFCSCFTFLKIKTKLYWQTFCKQLFYFTNKTTLGIVDKKKKYWHFAWNNEFRCL